MKMAMVGLRFTTHHRVFPIHLDGGTLVRGSSSWPAPFCISLDHADITSFRERDSDNQQQRHLAQGRLSNATSSAVKPAAASRAFPYLSYGSRRG